jgi:hypothetical protein
MNEKNILIGAQVFCWPKVINPLEHKTIVGPKALKKKTLVNAPFLGVSRVFPGSNFCSLLLC